MKLSPANLKSLDYKQLAINHGEKLVVSLIGLFIVFTLVGTRWSSYDKGTPKELADKAVAALQTVKDEQAHPWPKDEQEKYLEDVQPVRTVLNGQSYEVSQDVAEMVKPVEVARYDYNAPMSWPLIPPEQPIKEPEWLPVVELIADSGRALLEVREEPAEGEQAGEELAKGGKEEKADSETKVTEEDIPAQFRSRRGQGAGSYPGAATGAYPGAAPGAYAGAAPGAYPGAAPGGGYPGPFPGAGAFPGENGYQMSEGYMTEIETEYMEFSPEGPYGMMEGYGDLIGMEGMGRTGVNGRGVRYVAVRGVFPWKEQLDKIAKALNLQVTPNVSNRNLIQFMEFELQRQSAPSSAGPWSDRDEDWQPVDREVAMDVLREVTAFEPDIVNAGVIDQVFTMPLPRRVVGYWDTAATHPRIKNFELSQDEVDREVEINRKLLEMYKERYGRRQVLRKGGFAQLQYDIGGIRQEMLSQQGSTFMTDLARQIKEPEANANDPKQIAERIKQQITAAGRLLLFRYFDFDVEPGRAYRYRVRLVVTNPNFGRPVEDVISQDVVQGETRNTPWSTPTKPAVVPQDVQYFLTEVVPPRGRSDAAARLDVFEWLPDAGTVVNATVESQVGQFIGGKTQAEVLRPAPETFKKEDVDLAADDVLVDVVTAPKIDKSQHPDLDLSKNALDPLRNRLQITDRALVADQNGQLVLIDPYSRRKQRDRAAKFLEYERKPFEFIKERAKTPAEGSPLAEYAQEYLDTYGAEMGEEGMLGGKRRSRSNPIRRSSSSKSLMPSMQGMPAMPPTNPRGRSGGRR